MLKEKKKKYLVALTTFRGSKGFCHPTILVSAKNVADAHDIVRHIKGTNVGIGDTKEVNY